MEVGDKVVIWAPELSAFHLKAGHLVRYDPKRYDKPAWEVLLDSAVLDAREWMFFEDCLLTPDKVAYYQLCQAEEAQ